MKKMFTRIVPQVLVISMFLSLAGCTTNPTPSEGVTSPTQETSFVPEDTAVPSANVTVPEETTSPAESTTPLPSVPTTPPSADTDNGLGLTEQQMNSFSMLYYLAITAEEIRISKNNRLLLEDIYTSLLNDINPGAIDENTQKHLKNLRDIIKSYNNLSLKRERLQFIYNQSKAFSIEDIAPDPLDIITSACTHDFGRLADIAVSTVMDTYEVCQDASEGDSIGFLFSGWDLDDKETTAIQKNRERAFDYMVDMVQEYHLDGKLTLNERSIQNFAEICMIEAVQQKIRRLESEKEVYKLFGSYWFELADCYYEAGQYEKCLACIDEYNRLNINIYRKDYNYAQILPKAIVAAQEVYQDNVYISNATTFTDSIIENTATEEWAIRYFAAQVYLDLYARTKEQKYIDAAYNIIYDNVTILVDEQRMLNDTYLNDVEELEIEEPNYIALNKEAKKAAEQEYKDEQKRLKAYNKELKKNRETELPPLYDPLILNCDLLFALANEMQISDTEKAEIEAILQTSQNGIFLSKPINDRYSFSASTSNHAIELDKDKITIPADLLSPEAQIIVTVTDSNTVVTFDDFVISKVKREGNTIDSFLAQISSKDMKKYGWTEDSKVAVEIKNGYESTPLVFQFGIAEYKHNALLPDKVVFEAL